jgi:hypothetical protein
MVLRSSMGYTLAVVRIPPARFLDISERLFYLKRFQRDGGVAGLPKERRNRYKSGFFYKTSAFLGHASYPLSVKDNFFETFLRERFSFKDAEPLASKNNQLKSNMKKAFLILIALIGFGMLPEHSVAATTEITIHSSSPNKCWWVWIPGHRGPAGRWHGGHWAWR